MSENSATTPSVEDADRLLEKLFGKLEGVERDAEALPILVAEAQTIRTIAAAYRTTELFQRASDKRAEFKARIEADTPPEGRLLEAWQWLLDRMTNAPTGLHMVAAIRLCLPMVADYLPEAATEEKEPRA